MYFRKENDIDKSSLGAHILRPKRGAVCIDYDPLGPTLKTKDGVKY